MRRKRTTIANTTISTGMSQGSSSNRTAVAAFRFHNQVATVEK